MATTSTYLLSILECKSKIAYYTTQQMHWANLYESNAAKLNKHAKYEEEWNKAYDKVFDAEEGKEITYNGNLYENNCEATAESYANLLVEEYDEEMLLELQDYELEYESQKIACEALLEIYQAELEHLETGLSNAASDTGITGS